MNGPEIIARSISLPTGGAQGRSAFANGNAWQYHPRSDRHSKIACWSVAFDLLRTCELLRAHVADGRVSVAINHPMRDYARNRTKNLDLVICRASQRLPSPTANFAELVRAYSIDLTDEEERLLASLPVPPLAQPATVLVALEAKACMTEFGKARPRLYDELNSSHLTIHGDTDGAIAAGFSLVNTADTFVSPLRNPWPLGAMPTVISKHDQPRSARSVVDKLAELPRRSRPGEEGFDVFAITAIACRNDGSRVTVDRSTGLVPPIFDYSQAVDRLAHLYSTRFTSL